MEAGGLTCLRFPSSPRAQSHCETVERVYYILVLSKFVVMLTSNSLS